MRRPGKGKVPHQLKNPSPIRPATTTSQRAPHGAMPVSSRLTLSSHSVCRAAIADLAAEALREKRLEIRLVIDGEDFRDAHQSAAASNWRSCA
jgi:hypothetical protein